MLRTDIKLQADVHEAGVQRLVGARGQNGASAAQPGAVQRCGQRPKRGHAEYLAAAAVMPRAQQRLILCSHRIAQPQHFPNQPAPGAAANLAAEGRLPRARLTRDEACFPLWGYTC